MSIGWISYGVAVFAYASLSVLLVTVWRGRLTGTLTVIASSSSAVWALFAMWSLSSSVPIAWPWVNIAADWGRDSAWLLFLTHILVIERTPAIRRFWFIASLGILAIAAGITLIIPLAFVLTDFGWYSGFFKWRLLAAIGMAIWGLLLIEQLYRNRRFGSRWAIKHLCLGLGALFVYDLFFYSEALLLQRINPSLWEARGLINALAVPLIAVSTVRNPSWQLEFHVSRDVVFHSATLSATGLYLLAMSVVGYYLRFVGGNWGPVLQTIFLFAAIVLLVLLLFSAQLRARLRLILNTHFFSLKYDYRAEWLRFTNTLAASGANVTEAVISALAAMINSPGGWLWVRHETNGFEYMGAVHAPLTELTLHTIEPPLPQFLTRTGWVIDLAEYQRRGDMYEDLDCPAWLLQLPQSRLIIPLLLHNTLYGFVVLQQPRYQHTLNWEDYSLLKTAGLQAAVHVARHLANQALLHARQFEAFHQLSAYVAHDLKNLLAQHALIVANAAKHKQNPAFVDDVIQTISHSVERMQRLMVQLRDGVRAQCKTPIDLDAVLREAIAVRMATPPTPQLHVHSSATITADRERLLTILNHLLQNAQEATPSHGQVIVRLQREAQQAVIEIADNGVGMSLDFIRERLFRPFDSTKGLTGMGIGAYESREVIRSLGGELTVHSTPGVGTTVRICLPIALPV